MHTAIASLAALTLAAPAVGQDAPGGEAVTPYPAREVLAAFATACSTIEDMTVAKATVKAAGWEEFTPDPKSQLGQVLAIGKAAAQADENFEVIEGGTYRKTVADRKLELVLSGALVFDIEGKGCHIYDFSATIPPSSETLRDWAVRAPNETNRAVEGAVTYTWNPGLKPGHMEMEITFIAPGTKLPDDLPLSGLILQAEHLEFD